MQMIWMCRRIQQQMNTAVYNRRRHFSALAGKCRLAVDIPQRGGYNMRYLGIASAVMGIRVLKTKLQGRNI